MDRGTEQSVPANLVQLSSDNKTFVWVVNGGKAVKREISIRNETSQGAQVSSDLLEAQEQYQQACDRYTDAFAEFQMKQLEYRQATGQE